MNNKLIFLLVGLAFLSCVSEEPTPQEDFRLSFTIAEDQPIEGNGINSDEELLDLVDISISHSGELQSYVPIRVTTSGIAKAGLDYPSLPDTIVYNPFLNRDENGLTFRVFDDFVYEGGPESATLTFEYEVDGDLISDRLSFHVVDNDFRFELTWDSDADLELSVRRNHFYVFFDLGLGELVSPNKYVYDLSGTRDKWLMNSGYGCDVLYNDKKSASGNIEYTATFYLPDGQQVNYTDAFAEGDYLSDDTNHQLPMVVLRNTPDELFTSRFEVFFADETTTSVFYD